MTVKVEAHVVHAVGRSAIVELHAARKKGSSSARPIPCLFAGDDEGQSFYRLLSWTDTDLAEDQMAVYVLDDMTNEQAHAAVLDHWERLQQEVTH